MGDEQKYPPGFTPHTDTLKLPKGFTPSNLEKKKEVGGVASLIGGEVGSSNPQSQKARLSNYLYGLKTEDQKKMAQPSGGVVLNKKLKKNERPFDQTTEEAVKSGYDKLNELMYSDDDRWKDPVKALHKDYENNPAATISALGLVQMSLADSGLHAKKVLADTHFGTDNNNLTTELLKQRADQYDRIAQPFRDIQFTYENKPTDSPEDDYNAKDKIYDAAIRAYANANPMFAKQAEAAGLDLNGSDLVNKIGAKDESRYGSAMPGQIMNHIINDTDFLDYIQNENPKLFNAVKSVSDNLLTDQRAFGVNVVANEISRERQKLGFNNPIVEFDDKQFRRENDLVAEKLYADDPVKMKIYRDEVSQNADELIDTPNFLESFAKGAKGVYKGIGNTFSAPVTSIPSQIYKGWEQQANQVSAEPKGFSKFASGTGNVLGLVAALGGVSNVLGAGGAGFYSSRVAPFLAGSVPFAGDFWNEGVMKYPNNPTKAGISAGLQTILYGALSQKIFPAKEVEAAFSKIKPEVGKIVESLATNKITKEAAKQQSMTLLKKAFSQLGGGVKNAATISAELTAIQGASSAFDYFNMSDEEFKNHHPQGELADTFKSLFLDNLVLGNMTKYSEMRRGNKLLEESLYEAATNQKRYKRVIDEMEVTDPTISKEDMIGNLEFLSKLKAGLDRNGVSEKNQKRYLLEAAKERAIKSQRSQLPDENLTRKSEELLRHGQEVRQNILDDKPYDEQEIDQEVKPTTTDSDLLTTLQEMSEGDVKNQDLQFFIDQSSNAPHQFIENYGEGVTQELLDRATTEQLKKSLEDAKKFDGHPSVPILEHEISKREIDQQRELDMGTEQVEEPPSVSVQMPEEIRKPEVVEALKPTEEMSDSEIENRMMEIEDKGGDMKEFNRLEKEMEKRERATVFSVPLENVSAAVDALVKKDKEQPNGYGSFIERRDASETKAVAERYLKPKLISDAELKNDFKEAVMGNPDTWYADGLKLRESLKEAANRGIDTSEMVAEVEKEFVKDGYTSEDAKATVARKLSNIFENSQKVETDESKLLSNSRPTEETPTEQAPPEPPVAEPPGEGGVPTDPMESGGITHAANEVRRKDRALPEYEKSAQSFEQWNNEAERLIKEGYNVDGLMDKIEAGHDPNPVENAIRKIYIATLDAEIAKNPTDELLAKQKRFIEIGDAANSRAGRNLVSLKGENSPLDTISDFYVAKMEANGVDVLTEKQKQEVKAQFEAVQKAKEVAEAKVKELEAKVAELEAAKKIKNTKRNNVGTRKTSEEYKTDRAKLRDELKAAKEEHLKWLKDNNIQTSGLGAKFFLTPKMAKVIGKIIASHVDEVGANLAEVTERVFNEIKDYFDGITQKDVHDIIAGEYAEKRPTKTQLQKDLRDIRDEAELMNKLDKLLAGEEPASERMKIERNQKIKDLRDRINSIKKGEKLPEDAQALKRSIEESRRKEKELRDRIENKDFETEEKQTGWVNNKELKRKYPELYGEALDALAAKEQAKLDFDIALEKDRLSKRSVTQKGIDIGRSLIATTKAIKSGIDDSAVMMQNIVAMIAHPRSAVKALREHALDALSEKRFRRYLTELHNSPIWDLIVKSGLDITDPKSLKEQNKEEIFDNNLLNKDIKIKGKRYNIGKYVTRPFERAFTSLGNAMRVNMFTRIAEREYANGRTFESDPTYYKDLAKVLNTETGRGKLHTQVERASQLVTAGIWSPRLMASRINMLGISELAPLYGGKGYYAGLTPEIRKMAIADMVKFVGIGVAFMGWAALQGAEVDDDPESTSFGTIKVGNKRYNAWGGFTPYIKTIYQFYTGSRKTNGIRQEYNRGTNIGRFFRSRFTPAAGTVTNLVTGRDYLGKPVTVENELQDMVTPMSISGIVDGLKKDGAIGILTQGIPSFVGVGVSDERDFERKNRRSKPQKPVIQRPHRP